MSSGVETLSEIGRAKLTRVATLNSKKDVAKLNERIAAIRQKDPNSRKAPVVAAVGDKNVNVYFHVIRESTGEFEGGSSLATCSLTV